MPAEGNHNLCVKVPTKNGSVSVDTEGSSVCLSVSLCLLKVVLFVCVIVPVEGSLSVSLCLLKVTLSVCVIVPDEGCSVVCVIVPAEGSSVCHFAC